MSDRERCLTAITVVIPAHNGGQLLLDCISAVVLSAAVRTSIVVIDNASADGSMERAVQAFPDIEILRNERNRGFAAGCNQGITLALDRGAEFVMVLNQDAFLEPATLASMVQLAHEHPQAAAIGCTTLSTGTSGGRRGTLLYNGAWKGWPTLWQRLPGLRHMDSPPDRSPRQVDFVWGHAMLLRCASLRDVGLFDPGFFFYMEDLDLCDRLQQAGWQHWCDSRVVCWHAISDGARAMHSEEWRWHMKLLGSRRYYRKRMPRWRADASWMLTIARETLSLLRHGHRQAASDLMRSAFRIVRGDDSVRVPGVTVTGGSTAPQPLRGGCPEAAEHAASYRRPRAEQADPTSMASYLTGMRWRS